MSICLVVNHKTKHWNGVLDKLILVFTCLSVMTPMGFEQQRSSCLTHGMPPIREGGAAMRSSICSHPQLPPRLLLGWVGYSIWEVHLSCSWRLLSHMADLYIRLCEEKTGEIIGERRELIGLRRCTVHNQNHHYSHKRLVFLCYIIKCILHAL